MILKNDFEAGIKYCMIPIAFWAVPLSQGRCIFFFFFSNEPQWRITSLSVEMRAQGIDGERVARLPSALTHPDFILESRIAVSQFLLLDIGNGISLSILGNNIEIEQRVSKDHPPREDLVFTLAKEVVSALNISKLVTFKAVTHFAVPNQHPLEYLTNNLITSTAQERVPFQLRSARLSLDYEVKDSVLNLSIAPARSNRVLAEPHLLVRAGFTFRSIEDSRLFSVLSNYENYLRSGEEVLTSIIHNGDVE